MTSQLEAAHTDEPSPPPYQNLDILKKDFIQRLADGMGTFGARAFLGEIIAAACADAEARIEVLETAIQPFAEAYDDVPDYANQDVVELNELSGLTVRDIRIARAALADPPGRCEAEVTSRLPDFEQYRCRLARGHTGHHEDEGCDWTDETTRYPDPPEQVR